MPEIFLTLVGSLCGGGITVAIAFALLQRKFQTDSDTIAKHELEIKALREQDLYNIKTSINEVRADLRKHTGDDQSQAILNELKNIGGNIEKMSSEIKVLLVSDGKQQEGLVSLRGYVDGVNESFKECRREHRKNG